VAQAKSTQRILDCLTEGKCVIDDGDSGTVLVRMTRAQLLDLGVRGFTLTGCENGVYVMEPLPLHENWGE
jgi:hypothetical protein